MLDTSTSTRDRIHLAAGDTAVHPLYGIMVPDTGRFTSARVEQLHAGIDRIHPPVLLLAQQSPDARTPVREWTVLLLGTVSNRRDGVMMLDGAGLGMWIRQASTDEFRGVFGPWGIVSDDRGHFCARRMRD